MITLINHQGLKVMEGVQLQSPSPAIGLAYIGAFLRKHGYDYTAIDACGEALEAIRPYSGGKGIYLQGLTNKQVLERVPAQCRIIGFTCLFSHCWPLVYELATAIRRKHPDALFVLGGEHGTALPEQVLRSSTIDVIVMGEGEETFLELVRCVEQGREWKEIHGVAYLEEGQLKRTVSRKRNTDIDEFPYPDWDRWSIREYIAMGQVTGINLGRQMPILGSRGCPYDCKFCSNMGMWTRRYIMRDPKALVDEMEYMTNKYDVSGFTFMDLTFVVNRRKTLAFANELIARRLKIVYQLPAGTRCEAFDEELAGALDRSGLRNFAFAPESGSGEILKAIRKQVNIGNFLDAMRIALRTSMTIGCFIVIGFPEDSPRTMKQTLSLLRRLALMGAHDVTVSKFTPYPGSDYFNDLMRNGRISYSMDDLGKVINFFSSENVSFCNSLDAASLHRWMLWMYVNFYLISFLRRPWRVVRNLIIFFVRGAENTRYMRLVSEILVQRRKWRRLAHSFARK
jgi:radical SAM superfamily enzyme YgiQ (UPF0313 family)